jgi:hypothetical protein
MRSKMLGMALLALTGAFALGCQAQETGDDAYQEGGGNQRVDLPEEVEQKPQGRGVEMNVETGDQGERRDAPGRQEQTTPQADGSGSGAARSGDRGRSE